MELINSTVFICVLYVVRRNLFFLVFYFIFFIFCYSRYVVAALYPEYTLGAVEWVFRGVGNDSIVDYQFFFLVAQCIFFVVGLGVRSRSIYPYVLKNDRAFFRISFVVLFFLLLKSALIFVEIVKNGYLSAVDMQLPFLVSLVTSSTVKPLVLSLVLLAGGRFFSIEMKWVFLFLIVMAFSGQRKDIVSVFIFYFLYCLANSRFVYLKVSLGLSCVILFSTFIFWLREENYTASSAFFIDLIWSIGASLNPGLLVLDSRQDFHITDSLGFLTTYFSCGVGKLFTDLCVSSDRIYSSGFLLEKIATYLSFEEDTVFGGIGGNLIASLFVGSGFSELPVFFAWLIYLILVFIVAFYFRFIFQYLRMSVVGALFVCQLLVASRYAFDAFIPPVNQLIFAFILDIFFVKRLVCTFHHDR